MNNIVDINKNEKSAGKLSAFWLSVLTVIFSALTFVSMRFGIVLALFPFFIGAVACLTSVFYFFRNPLAVALPFIAFAVNLTSPVSTLGCGWLILICSLVIFLCLRGKIDTFPLLICGSTVYALTVGGAFTAFIIHAFGNVSNAVEVFENIYTAFVSTAFAQLDTELVYMYGQMFDQFLLTLPAVFVVIGLLAMWTTKAFIGLIAQTATGNKNVFGKVTHAPGTLAFIFLLISLVSVFFTFSDMETYFAMNNVSSVLMFVFMGEGISAFIFERNPAMSQGKFIMTIVVVSVLMFVMPSLAVTVVSYYGVLRTFSRKKISTEG